MLPKISSTFTHYAASETPVPNFKDQFFMVLPKFLIFVNGHSFEFTNSPYWLSNRAGLKQATLVFNAKREWCVKEGKSIYTLSTYYGSSFSSRRNVSIPDNPNLTDKDRLFAFLCLLQDASIAFEYCDVDDFLSDFGYDIDIKQIRKGEEVFRNIKENTKKLGYTQSQVTELIDVLAEMGIE